MVIETITINRCCFSYLFNWCEKKYNIEWNTCCDLFHASEVINYSKSTDVFIGWGSEMSDEVLNAIEKGTSIKDLEGEVLAYVLIEKFLIDNGVESCEITGA